MTIPANWDWGVPT